MIWRAILVWLALLMVAVGAGGLRTALLEPRLEYQAAHVLGTLAVVVVFAIIIWRAVAWIDPALNARRLVAIGVGWAVATIVFEFSFGHYVAGHPWSQLLADYNIFKGRLWTLVLLTVLLGPSVAGAVRRAVP